MDAMDEKDYIEMLIAKGWTYDGENWYCPQCSKEAREMTPCVPT